MGCCAPQKMAVGRSAAEADKRFHLAWFMNFTPDEWREPFGQGGIDSVREFGFVFGAVDGRVGRGIDHRIRRVRA